MSWFKKILPSRIQTDAASKKDIPEGLWSKCDQCAAVLYRLELKRNLNVCPKCNHHMRLTARQRLNYFLDENSGKDIRNDIEPHDKLRFRDLKKYRDRLHEAQKKTHEYEALIVQSGTLMNQPLIVAAFEFNFMGGSMGAAVGERFVQGVNSALERKVPFICFTASGGARMQEALISLMQMAKVSAILARLGARKLPYISILTDPTMGGVSASLAMLGDIIIAEPKALIGFAGPRVIEQTMRATLPEGFQRSEFLFEHGAIDLIISRLDMRQRVAGILSKLAGQRINV